RSVPSAGNIDHDGGLVGRDRRLRRWVNVTRAHMQAVVPWMRDGRKERRRARLCCAIKIQMRGKAPRPLPDLPKDQWPDGIDAGRGGDEPREERRTGRMFTDNELQADASCNPARSSRVGHGKSGTC